ncbi:MAG: hypothetical protein PHV95_09060 [Eubacteriales bacterium]|nr:hypothetical protein [Eubacteriales bacterium]MDD4475916.1 hypothetical protein [Eubacteriales bacterium]
MENIKEIERIVNQQQYDMTVTETLKKLCDSGIEEENSLLYALAKIYAFGVMNGKRSERQRRKERKLI